MRHQIDFIIIDPRYQDFSEYIRKYNSYSEGRLIDFIPEANESEVLDKESQPDFFKTHN